MEIRYFYHNFLRSVYNKRKNKLILNQTSIRSFKLLISMISLVILYEITKILYNEDFINEN